MCETDFAIIFACKFLEHEVRHECGIYADTGEAVFLRTWRTYWRFLSGFQRRREILAVHRLSVTGENAFVLVLVVAVGNKVYLSPSLPANVVKMT